MRIEPHGMDRDGLERLLRDRYGLDVVSLAFVPYGIDSWSYVATCRDGGRVFVKLRRPEVSTATTGAEMPLMAALAAAGLHVPRPIADRDGCFLGTLGEYDVRVHEYLEGRALEKESDWPDDLYALVAEIVAAVHATTMAVRSIVERVEDYELPFLPQLEAYLAAIEAGDPPPANGETMAGLHEIAAPRATQLLAEIDRLRQLRVFAAGRDTDMVLCHTDIWGSNLLLSTDGTLYLLDWDGALMGPREYDLFMFAGTTFFPPDRFAWFLDRYEAASGQLRLDADAFAFYLHRRHLEDLAWFVASIRAGNNEAMTPAAALAVAANLLDETTLIERHVDRVRDVLAARPSSARR
jgi:spectinomycin phosphotransferase